MKTVDALHHAFYARYLSVGDRAYSPGSRNRISGDDRLVLLIGELHTNVSTPCFAEYLASKGRRRAQSALRALTIVGATRTARMLSAALEPAAPPSRLSAIER